MKYPILLRCCLRKKKKYEEAAVFMGEAAENMPGVARVHYNYGILLQSLNRDSEAEFEFKKALSVDPENMDFLYALFDFYFKRSKFDEAKVIAEAMVGANPELPAVKELLEMVEKF